MIVVDSVRKTFGPVVAVDNVSFTANNGEIIGLLGPNGAGKTTVMRMITALFRPDKGYVLVDSINTSSDPIAARAKLGVLSDSRALYPRLTAREHIVYSGELHGLSSQVIAQRANQLLERLGLTAVADRVTQGFSQGERMKVAIARALVHEPSNVILDEPTNGLDVMSARSLRQVVQSLKAEGRCVVFSSHLMNEVASLCDRIILVSKGTIIATCTPAELQEQMATNSLEDAFVAAITEHGESP